MAELLFCHIKTYRWYTILLPFFVNELVMLKKGCRIFSRACRDTSGMHCDDTKSLVQAGRNIIDHLQPVFTIRGIV